MPPLSENSVLIGSHPTTPFSSCTLQPTARRKSSTTGRPEMKDQQKAAQSNSSIPQTSSNQLAKSTVISNSNQAGWSALDLSGLGLRNLSPTLWSYFEFLSSLYLGGNCLTSLPPQIIRLSNLETLDVSHNFLKTLPPELGRMTWLKKIDLFNNLLNILPIELGYLYQLECFIIDDNPLIEPLYSLNQSQGGSAVIMFLRDNNNMSNVPAPERQWITSANSETAGFYADDLITLLSFNILSERYASPQMYGYVPSWALEWSYRREMIINELVSYNSDLVLLQEIDLGTYEDYFKPQLEGKFAGYESVFFPKSRSKTMNEIERKGVDGCATFFKSSRFKLEETFVLEFSQLASKKPEITCNEESFQRLIVKDNIAVICRLTDQAQAGRQFIIANVHIHWNPEFKDVKLIQCILLMEELDKIVARFPGAFLLIAGDFNSTPDSGVFRLLSQGFVTADDVDFAGFKYSPYTDKSNVSILQGEKGGAKHMQSLRSAYSTVLNGDPSKLYTNVSPWFRGHIDYIWYTSQSPNILVPTGILGGIPNDYLSRIVGIPTQHFPSDHISIMAEFRISTSSASTPSTSTFTSFSSPMQQRAAATHRSPFQKHFEHSRY